MGAGLPHQHPHAYFYLTRACLPHLAEGASIVNTTSVNAYKGNPHLIAYSSTKGAIVAFTRSIATALMDRGIRVNGGSRRARSGRR